MINNENLLLKNALIYENGHKRRTQHILKVYALSSCIATSENLTEEQLTVIKAATILHDIAIKSCKEKYGNAEQSLQQKEALNIVPTMLLPVFWAFYKMNGIAEMSSPGKHGLQTIWITNQRRTNRTETNMYSKIITKLSSLVMIILLFRE